MVGPAGEPGGGEGAWLEAPRARRGSREEGRAVGGGRCFWPLRRRSGNGGGGRGREFPAGPGVGGRGS